MLVKTFAKVDYSFGRSFTAAAYIARGIARTGLLTTLSLGFLKTPSWQAKQAK